MLMGLGDAMTRLFRRSRRDKRLFATFRAPAYIVLPIAVRSRISNSSPGVVAPASLAFAAAAMSTSIWRAATSFITGFAGFHQKFTLLLSSPKCKNV